MERYDYLWHITQDVIEYVRNEVDTTDYRVRDDLEEALFEDLFCDDSVTGNASGSYTFSTWRAEENLAHNWELIEEAAQAFGAEAQIGTGYENGAEYWDVTIRCYLLPQAISDALDRLEEEGIVFGEDVGN